MSTPRRVGVVAATAAGRILATRIAAALTARAVVIERPTAAAALREAFADADIDAVVAVLAAGAVVRILAPQIAAGAKHRDPAVITVDEAGRFVVPVLGGHAAGANDLAEQIAAVLDATAVLTTATDATGLPGLDALGWPVSGDVAAVSRRILDGEPVRVHGSHRWPLPAMGPNVTVSLGAAPSDVDVLITDRIDAEAPVVLRPPSLVAGMGASRGVPTDEAAALLHAALEDAGLSVDSLSAIATADVKADEVGLVELARRLGVPLVTHPASTLAAVDVPNPSEVVRRAVGTASVAEAAAVLGHGVTTGELIVPKRVGAMATVAVARHAPRGRLAVVGLGPGSPELLTPAAREQLRRAEVVVGLDQYVEQIRPLLRPGTRVQATGLGHEEQRAHGAVALAREGHAVALIGSGDAGVYAMASPALEVADETIEVVVVPGITAGLAASAVLGAPLGHDHCYLSLSDLHTPWPVIERRVRAAAEADLVTLCYNPRSRARDWQLARAVQIFAEHRPRTTPVGVVRNATRSDESAWIDTLDCFAATGVERVDMYSLVVIGASTTALVGGRMVTPRGYRWAP